MIAFVEVVKSPQQTYNGKGGLGTCVAHYFDGSFGAFVLYLNE
jgi:hypothetical protein